MQGQRVRSTPPFMPGPGAAAASGGSSSQQQSVVYPSAPGQSPDEPPPAEQAPWPPGAPAARVAQVPWVSMLWEEAAKQRSALWAAGIRLPAHLDPPPPPAL